MALIAIAVPTGSQQTTLRELITSRSVFQFSSTPPTQLREVLNLLCDRALNSSNNHGLPFASLALDFLAEWLTANPRSVMAPTALRVWTACMKHLSVYPRVLRMVV